MIPISEVLEACALECENYSADRRRAYKTSNAHSPDRANPYVEGQSDGASECAEAIRALIPKYEGCIVAEGKAGAYTILDKLRLPKEVEVRLSENGYVPQLIPRYELTPLYRAKEIEMNEPIKLPPIPDGTTGWYTMHNEQIKQWGRLAVEQATADLRAEVERLREVLKELIRYAKGVHDPHLEELIRDFLKETK